MKQEDIRHLVEHIEEWEAAGAFGHIVLSVRPSDNDPGNIGTVSYFTFGPAPGTPEVALMTDFMDQVLNEIGQKLVKQ